ncbi:MFS transporter [Plantactinospora sp. GCM10030261]|uniref:MFS transporter n=1 Tax=Plantactinospora sp. GCM10030261 TaxID=3273420 RepID=UPI003619E977
MTQARGRDMPESSRAGHRRGAPIGTAAAAPPGGGSQAPVGTTAVAAPPTRRRAALIILLAGSTLTVLAGAVLAPVVELFRTELRLGGAAAGLILTAHGLSLAVAGPLVGRAIDRWGVRVPLAAGLILYGLAGGAGLVTDSYPALIATRLLFGVGAAVVFAGTTLGLLNLYEGAARDRAMGWRSAAISIGGVLFPLAGGLLGTLSWHAPFAAYLIGVPLGLLTLRALPDHRPGPPGGAGRPGSMVALLRDRPALVGIYGLQATCTLLLYAVLVFLPLRLAEVGVTDTTVVAIFAGVQSLVMTLVGLGYARIRGRWGQRHLLVVAFATWLVALTVLGLTGATALMLAASAVFGIGMGLAVPALTVLVADHSPVDRRGQATALLASAIFAGQFVSPLLLGPVAAAGSTRAAFLAAAALTGVILAVLSLSSSFGRSRTTTCVPR